MKFNKAALIYGLILALGIGYYCYCSFTGKSIYGLGERTTWENNDNPSGSGGGSRSSFRHK